MTGKMLISMRVLSSPPFRFIIGCDRKEFFLHPKAVSRASAPLGALVDGQMSEAKERCALIEDIGPQTFARVGQYVYTGDYHAADYHVLLDDDFFD